MPDFGFWLISLQHVNVALRSGIFVCRMTVLFTCGLPVARHLLCGSLGLFVKDLTAVNIVTRVTTVKKNKK